MAGATYSVYLCDPFGVRIADASNFVKLQYSRAVNDVGTVKLWLPADFDTTLLRIPHGRIEIWRRVPGTTREVLETETTWLIQAVQYDRDQQGSISILVEADTPLCLLRDPGRVVAVYNNFWTSGMTADDLIKYFCLYHGITSTPSQIGITRADSSVYPYAALGNYISAQPSLALAPAYSEGGANKFVSWKPLLTVLREIAQYSANLGTYLAFDIMAPTPDTLELRTYIQQRGVDHRFPSSTNPVIFGADFGNVASSTLRDDRRKEVTAAWVGGAGQPNVVPGQLVTNPPSFDLTRITSSPFGWRETYIADTQQTDANALAAASKAAVYAGRPRKLYAGRLLSAPGCQYGVHWGWGDYVTVQDFGLSFDCRIEAITVTVDRGKESIDAYARNDT